MPLVRRTIDFAEFRAKSRTPQAARPGTAFVRVGRLVHSSMRSGKRPMSAESLPQTRSDLQEWVRANLRLPATLESALLRAIDAVFVRHERLWRQSKDEAIQALSAGFAEKMAHVQHELSAREATVSSIS